MPSKSLAIVLCVPLNAAAATLQLHPRVTHPSSCRSFLHLLSLFFFFFFFCFSFFFFFFFFSFFLFLLVVSRRTHGVPFPLVYSTAPGLCTRVVCASTCVHTRRCTPREQRRVLRPELSRSHGSSSGSGGDIPTYLPISLAARACVSQATLCILLLSLLPRVVVQRRSSPLSPRSTP